MADSYYYQLYISDTEPTKPAEGLFWLKPSIGQLFYRISSSWYPIAGGEAIADYTEGYSWKAMKIQESAPTVESGLFWIANNTLQVYIGGWVPVISG